MPCSQVFAASLGRKTRTLPLSAFGFRAQKRARKQVLGFRVGAQYRRAEQDLAGVGAETHPQSEKQAD